jgi:hypothetical protein
MDNAIVHRRTLVVFTLALVLALAVVVVLPKASSAAPPERVHDTFTVEDVCDFPVLLEATGKAKGIELPGGRFLDISPGLRVTLTNEEEPTHQLTYVITGAFHGRDLADGRLLVVATGRNLLFDPSFGMFLTVGRFTFQVNEDGSITRPEGKGRMIDICSRLA